MVEAERVDALNKGKKARDLQHQRSIFLKNMARSLEPPIRHNLHKPLAFR